MRNKWIMCVSMGILCLSLTINGFAQVSQPSERELQLEKMVKELTQRVEELEKKAAQTDTINQSVSELKQQVAEKAAEPEKKTAPEDMSWKWKNGLTAQSADGAFTFKFGLRAQNDWYVGTIDNGDFRDGTRFRRFWLNLSGTMYNDFEYKLQYALETDGITRWKDAWIAYNGLDFMKIRAGLFKEPFSMEELLLRIGVFLKRTLGTDLDEKEFSFGSTNFDYMNLTVVGPNTDIRLTQKEADLLRFFCLNANKVVKREEVLTKVWGKDDYFLGRSMDVFITKIRKYLKDEPEIEIQTIHGVGFRFVNGKEEVKDN